MPSGHGRGRTSLGAAENVVLLLGEGLRGSGMARRGGSVTLLPAFNSCWLSLPDGRSSSGGCRAGRVPARPPLSHSEQGKNKVIME